MNTDLMMDALGLLPTDLIAPVEALRARPRKKPVMPWPLIAACLALVLCAGAVMTALPARNLATESAADAPAAAAPQMESAADEAPAAGVEETPMEDAALPELPEPVEEEVPSAELSGEITVKLCPDGEEHILTGESAAMVTALLGDLPYDPAAVTRSMAEFRLDAPALGTVEVNLTEAFARCALGQAALTEDQLATLRSLLPETQ